ncbi:chemotaxis protein CheW [Desulfovibrio aminophilus]|nr:chemotaxis protein CheW [Desulfovibrio aminophilus]MCM0756150.1 chemotaxis protein CheW [Desulfovibrio aminophilus]
MKTPETYFIEDVKLPGEERGGALSQAEQAFLDKYVGLDQEKLLSKTPRVDPRGDAVMPGFAAKAEAWSEDEGTDAGFEARVREMSEVQLVSFAVDNREFALPIMVIQEVIKYVPPTKLPTAPSFIAGIINLRGKVTPLLRLRSLMGLPSGSGADDRFIVVCRHRGLQVGLMIQSVATMYRARHEDVDWGVAAHFGDSAEFLMGLLKNGDKLVSILSIDRLVEGVLRREGGPDA